MTFARPLLFGLVLFLAKPAAADDRARAETLFQEGRALIEQGKTADACAKFDESNKLDPAAGTQLNLASCWEKIGKTASAWALYAQLASTMKDARGRFAADHAAQLLPTLSKLTVTAPASARVTVDGAALPPGSYGVAVPVDPGSHVVDAVAGDKHFRRSVTVAANAASVTVAVTF